MNKFKKCVFCNSCISKYKKLMCTNVKIKKGIVDSNYSCKYFIIDKGG